MMLETKTGGSNKSIKNEEEYRHGANNCLKIEFDLCDKVKAKHRELHMQISISLLELCI